MNERICKESSYRFCSSYAAQHTCNILSLFSLLSFLFALHFSLTPSLSRSCTRSLAVSTAESPNAFTHHNLHTHSLSACSRLSLTCWLTMTTSPPFKTPPSPPSLHADTPSFSLCDEPIPLFYLPLSPPQATGMQLCTSESYNPTLYTSPSMND